MGLDDEFLEVGWDIDPGAADFEAGEVFFDLVQGGGEAVAALLDDAEVGGDVGQFVEAVGGHEGGDVLIAGELADKSEQFVAGGRVEAADGFVEDEALGLGGEGVDQFGFGEHALG